MAQIKKSGWISFIIVLVIIGGIYFVRKSHLFYKYHDYYAYYKGVAGLQPSSPVMIKGVRVGKIKSIDIGVTEVKVTLSIDKDVDIPADSKATLTSGGLLSDMSIVVNTGTSKTILPDNSRMAADLDTSAMPVSVRVTPYLETAKYLLSGFDTTITGIDFLTSSGMFTTFINPLMSAEKTLGKYATASANAYKTVNGLNSTLLSIDTSAGRLADQSKKWHNSLADLNNKTRSLRNDSINKSVTELAALTKRISKATNTVADPKNATGKLLNDKTAYNNAAKSVADINESATELQKDPPGIRLIGKNKKKKK